MIATIARKEFVCLLRDGRFKWVAIIMAILLLTSLWTGYSRYLNLKSIQNTTQATTEDQWVNQDDKKGGNPRGPCNYPTY